jgi:MFS family permease
VTTTNIPVINTEAQTYKRVAIAACFGTFLEWYDFLTFATLAVVFGPLFFPSSDPTSGLLASLATFGVGMIIRPLGAAIFGSLGDRIGRKPVFMLTILLMGVATVSVGLLPTYAQIGIWAPILLVSLRLLQGLSAGGEIGGSAVYLTEHAGEQNRGFKTSFLQLMGPLGVLASTIQITLLQHWLSADEFQSWGWRVPFWISLGLLCLGFKARIALEETPIFLAMDENKQQSKNPLRENFKDVETLKKMFLLFFCVSSGGSILFFCTQVYTTIFLKTSANLPTYLADSLSIYATLTLMPLTILAGWASDRLGRKPVVVAGLFLGAIFIMPAFKALQALSLQYQAANTNCYLLSILVGLSAILAMVVGPQTALLAELFPARTRNSAATLPHNLAAGWIGGLLPLILTWLNQQWMGTLMGLWYPAIFLGISAIVASVFLPETLGKNLNL